MEEQSVGQNHRFPLGSQEEPDVGADVTDAQKPAKTYV